jgi:hypothetical protein
MRSSLVLAASLAAGLSFHTGARAQMSVDQAHATVNRLLNGAGDQVIMRGGRAVDAYFTLGNLRTNGQCTTTYKGRVPSHPDIPARAHGTSGDGEIAWGRISDTRAEGRNFYRRDGGAQSTGHFRFGSANDAARFAEAAEVIMAACGSGRPKVPDQAVVEQVHDNEGNSASLAIDRRNGTRYGWAVDYPGWVESDRRALAECQRNGGRCQVVLRFTGGCGAYAADQAKGSSVYGWGTARSRQDAENRARGEARTRGGTNVVTRVWGCNSAKAAGKAGTTSAGKASAPGGSDAGNTSGAGSTGLPGRGKLSPDVIQRNEAAAAAHRASVERYEQSLKANKDKLEQSVAQRRAVDEAHQRELAKAKAAREQYERERAAYREEYKRVTGRYPD